MKRPRVLASAYACSPSATLSLGLYPGEATSTWSHLKQLNRFYQLWVITRARNRPGIEQARGNGEVPGIEFHYVDLSWLSFLEWAEFSKRIYYLLWQGKAFLLARRLHRQVRFDVAHHLSFHNDWIPSFIGAFLPVPFIWGPLGGGQRTPKGFEREYTLAGRVAEMARTLAQWVARLDPFVRYGCLKRARAILVCNQETAEKIPQRWRQKVHYFPVNGIIEAYLNPAPGKGPPNGPFRILIAGRLHRLKGVGLALKGFASFAEKCSDTELIIVGEGPEQERLQKLAGALRVQEKVQFRPWMSQWDLVLEMRSFHVFVFPSFRDGGGAVVVQAMAAGIPVICLDTAGPRMHVTDKCGIKIPLTNPEAFVVEMAQALERLYRDSALRSKMGEAARQRAEQIYVWDRHGEHLKEIYQAVLDHENTEF